MFSVNLILHFTDANIAIIAKFFPVFFCENSVVNRINLRITSDCNCNCNFLFCSNRSDKTRECYSCWNYSLSTVSNHNTERLHPHECCRHWLHKCMVSTLVLWPIQIFKKRPICTLYFAVIVARVLQQSYRNRIVNKWIRIKWPIRDHFINRPKFFRIYYVIRKYVECDPFEQYIDYVRSSSYS